MKFVNTFANIWLHGLRRYCLLLFDLSYTALYHLVRGVLRAIRLVSRGPSRLISRVTPRSDDDYQHSREPRRDDDAALPTTWGRTTSTTPPAEYNVSVRALEILHTETICNIRKQTKRKNVASTRYRQPELAVYSFLTLWAFLPSLILWSLVY